MSAAFDTVDHQILLHRLERSFGLTGNVLSWLTSFLDGRTQQVVFNGMASIVAALSSGIPQGSVLGPLLFLLYTADIPVIASDHGLGIHCYTDDGQLYIFEKSGNADSMISKVTVCISEIDKWMSSNRLKLNSEKTQFIWLGSSQQLQKITVDSITLAGSTLFFQSSVNDLGVLIDGRLSMCDHVEQVCRSSYYQLRQLHVIWNSLWTKTCAALVHAFVTNRLDYCNSLLASINKELLNKLESVLRSTTRLAMGKRKFDPITEDMRDILHWLPVRQRIDFKLGVLVFKCLRGDAPSYLVESVSSLADQPNLRSHPRWPCGATERNSENGPTQFLYVGSNVVELAPTRTLFIRTHFRNFQGQIKISPVSICLHILTLSLPVRRICVNFSTVYNDTLVAKGLIDSQISRELCVPSRNGFSIREGGIKMICELSWWDKPWLRFTQSYLSGWYALRDEFSQYSMKAVVFQVNVLIRVDNCSPVIHGQSTS